LEGRDPGVAVLLLEIAKSVDITCAGEFEQVEQKKGYPYGAVIHSIGNLQQECEPSLLELPTYLGVEYGPVTELLRLVFELGYCIAVAVAAWF
jgi:hypothetical protein